MNNKERRDLKRIINEKLFDNGLNILEHTISKSFFRAVNRIKLVSNTQKKFCCRRIFIFIDNNFITIN